MKKNKIVATLLLVCLTAVMLCGAAFGDVIAEPNDDFYSQHSEECTYVGREYYANGPTGYLEVFKQPGGSSLGFANNGEDFLVEFTYLEGSTQWGIISFELDDGRIESGDYGGSQTGWVKMSEMTVKYDSQEFIKDNGDKIKAAGTETVDLTGIYNRKIIFWEFPHSGEDYSDDSVITEADGIEFDSYYTDEEGLVWGHCGYFYGFRDFWVCISDPGNENLSVTNHTPTFFTPAPNESTNPQASASPTPTAAPSMDLTLIIIISVAALVVITVVVILLVRSKNNKDKNEQDGQDK